MDAVSYKCLSCGSALFFNENIQKLKCKSCGNQYDLDVMKKVQESKKESSNDFSWNDYNKDSGSGDWSEDEQEKIEVNTCPSCGAEIISDKTTAATSCVYCGNPTIINKRVSGTFRPDYVIPFKIDKKKAQENLLNLCKKKPLLPKNFIPEYSIDKITGIYVPFWLFDCNTDADITYNAKKRSYWSDSSYDYVKTDHYLLIRKGDISFKHLPVDASTKMDENFMEAIEPFKYEDAVDFDTAFLSGYLADKYDRTAEESKPRANERVKNSTIAEFRKMTSYFEDVTTQKADIIIKNGKSKYALLPTWLLSTKYHDKIYRFAVNGQTGKCVGEFPISTSKTIKWFLLLTLGLSIFISIIMLFLHL